MTSLPLLGFWAFAQPNIKILAWNFVHRLVAHSSIIYIIHFYIYKTSFLGHLFLKNQNLDFGAQKPQISKIRDSHFAEPVIWHPSVFFFAFYFKTLHSRSIWMLAVFRHKIAWHDVAKASFSQNDSTDFAENLCIGAKLMLN